LRTATTFLAISATIVRAFDVQMIGDGGGEQFNVNTGDDVFLRCFDVRFTLHSESLQYNHSIPYFTKAPSLTLIREKRFLSPSELIELLTADGDQISVPFIAQRTRMPNLSCSELQHFPDPEDERNRSRGPLIGTRSGTMTRIQTVGCQAAISNSRVLSGSIHNWQP
jgi:hypothetical protein